MQVYAQKSGIEVDAWFESVPGVPTVPTTVHWRVRNVTIDEIVIDWTEGTYTIESNETGITGVRTRIDIPGSANVLSQQGGRRETFELQVVADKDTDREYSVEPPYQYAIAYRGAR